MKTATFWPRDGWPTGPWDDEPDRIEWRDEDTGYPCLMLRNRFGAWCGYVGLPPGHPWHGESYDDLPVQVHGGLTFASGCDDDPSVDPAERVCHVPEEGEPADVWWLGFDCGHGDDLMPGIDRRYWPFRDVTYRDVSYVQNEVHDLAGQVKAHERRAAKS